MLGWIMIAASCTIMSRVADAEDRNGFYWGALTLILCLACDYLLSWPLVPIAIGFGISFMTLFVMKVIQD